MRAVYECRARAELDLVAAAFPGSDIIGWRGSLTPAVAVMKGLPGPSEASGGTAVSGADGDAIVKALERLGNDPGHVFFALSRPVPSVPGSDRSARVRMLVEAVDAPLVVALDREASDDVKRAFELDEFEPGVMVRSKGRRFVWCDGLEESLGDERRKQLIWRQLSAAVPQAPVY